jgi:sugar lactone lactonase YvrE
MQLIHVKHHTNTEDKNMKSRWISLIVFLSFTTLLVSLTPKSLPNLQGSSAWGDEDTPLFPKNATFTTLITTPRAIEGLTGDNHRNLYTGGSGPAPCPIWKIDLTSPSLVEVGNIPLSLTSACAFTGIAFNDIGDLFVGDGAAGRVYILRRNSNQAEIYASGVPGANGLAFDKHGNLWTGDGTTGLGRVWKIEPGGGTCEDAVNPFQGCKEVFRIQPMANDLDPLMTGGISNVGSDRRTLPPGTIGTIGTTVRTATNTGNSQPLVANGLAFDKDGDELFIADTARGAIWKVRFNSRGDLRSKTGCDTTFTRNTLCLDNIFVAHPFLEGADGIALDRAGNIWVDANERQAVVVVTKNGKVVEVFRNPVNSVGLRNSADPAVGNDHILEFPTSPFLTGKLFCTANSDGNRRDNSPRDVGEINGGAVPDGINLLGKISCMEPELKIPGLRLPID